MESPLWMEQCASFSLLHVVMSLLCLSWNLCSWGLCPEPGQTEQFSFVQTGIIMKFYVTSVLRQCLLGTFVFPFAIHLWWAGNTLQEKRKRGPLFLFGASPIMSSCEVELGLFCWDNCMMVQQKLGLYSLPGTVWRKKHFLASYLFFSICLKFCINNAN